MLVTGGELFLGGEWLVVECFIPLSISSSATPAWPCSLPEEGLLLSITSLLAGGPSSLSPGGGGGEVPGGREGEVEREREGGRER